MTAANWFCLSLNRSSVKNPLRADEAEMQKRIQEEIYE